MSKTKHFILSGMNYLPGLFLLMGAFTFGLFALPVLFLALFWLT